MTINNELKITSTCVGCGRETTGTIKLDYLGSYTTCQHCSARFDILPDETCVIKCFRDSYAFLSNFYPCRIEHNGLVFGCVEAAFQAQKCIDRSEREAFQYYDGSGAKKEGRRVRLRSGWDGIKANILRELLYIKFQSNPLLRKTLLQTGTARLVEFNTWHDNFFGNCYCPRCFKTEGENTLGKLLMEVRTSLVNGSA